MAYTSSLNASALLWSMASLNGSGGSGVSGEPGAPGTQWYFENGPLTDGMSAPLGSNVGDIVMDNTDTELFRVVNDGGNLVLASTGVTLRPESEKQKSLYELYLDLEPKKPLTQAQFHDRFLEALEEHPQFNLYEFYKNSGGLKYTTEKDFNDQFIKLMDLDLSSLDIETDRIVSKDGSVSVIAENYGVEVDTKTLNINASESIVITSVEETAIQGSAVIIDSTDDLVNGSTYIKGVVDPVKDLDAVNKRTLTKEIDTVNKSISDLEDKVDKINTDLVNLSEQHTKDILQINDDLDAIRKKHSEDDTATNKRIDDLELENTNLKNQITTLETKHKEDVDNLQEQIDNLENSLITAINIFLQDKLPDMVKEIVEEYLKDHPSEGCNCEYPPDVIYGGDAEAQIKELLYVFDNGNADTNEFDYIMLDYDDPAIVGNEIYRVAEGGDANPDDDEKNTMTFEEWLEMMNLTNVWEGGSAEEREGLWNSFILWNGGTADTSW